MMRSPTLEAINAAELRVVQSTRSVRLGVDRTNSALRATLARPSTLVTVAIASGITGYLLTHRRRATVKGVPIRADSPSKPSSPSLLRTLVSMYGVRVLTLALQLGAAAGKKSEPGAANPPAPSAPSAPSGPSAPSAPSAPRATASTRAQILAEVGP